MKDSPHGDETSDGTRDAILEIRSEEERNREHQSENERGSCEGKEEWGGAGVPLGNWDSLKTCAISPWSLVLVNRVPAVLLFKVKYIHKLIKLSVMINVTEGESLLQHNRPAVNQ